MLGAFWNPRKADVNSLNGIGIAFVLCAVFSSFPSQAAMGPGPKVYVFPYQGLGQGVSQEVLGQATELLKNEIKSNLELQLQKGPVFVPESESKVDTTNYHEMLPLAEKFWKEGLEHYHGLRFDRAIGSFTKAMDYYEKSLAILPDLSNLVDCMLMLSVCYFRRDQEDLGIQMLVKVIRIQPELELDPEKYPPIFRSTRDSVRKKLLLKARGELEIMANVDGAEVVLNGLKLGKTPLLLRELIPGDHYLRVEKEGLRSWAGKTVVISTKRQKVLAALGGVKKATGDLGEIAQAIRDNRLDPEIVKRIQEEGAKIGSDFVVVGAIQRLENRYQVSSFLVRQKDGQACRLATLLLDQDFLGATVEVYNLVQNLAKLAEGCSQPPTEEQLSFFDNTPSQLRAKITSVVAGPSLPEEPPEEPQKNQEPTTLQPVQVSTVATDLSEVLAEKTTPPPSKPEPSTLGPAQPRVRSESAPETRMPALPPKTIVSQQGLVTSSKTAIDSSEGPNLMFLDSSILVTKVSSQKSNPWYASWWFWTGVGVVVVTGTATALLAAGVFDTEANRASISLRW